MKKTSQVKFYIFGLIAVAFGILFDQYTKWLAVSNLKDKESFIIIKDVFQLTYLENRGAAFGMLQNQKILFAIGSVIVFFVMAYYYKKMPFTKKYAVLHGCICLIIAGAAGNLIDRMRLGYVVDFFYFELINFPVFNVADIYIVVATFLAAIIILFVLKDDDFTFSSKKKDVEYDR